MKSFMKVRIVLALALAGLFAAACKDATGPETLSTLTITPATATVGPNGTVQFTAAGTRTGSPVTTLVGQRWSVTGGGTISNSGLFTAPTTPGTSTITVTCGGLSTVATVIVTAGPLATITVTPNPILAIGAQQQFTAVGRDAFGNVVAITPVWSTTNPPGTINASTGLFTAGTTPGTYAASVRATSGSIFGTATVIVTSPAPAPVTLPPPLPATALGFRMIARVAWTCTDGSIAGSVATNQTASEAPPGSITQTLCPISGTREIGTPAAKQAYQDFLTAYTAREATACGTTLTGTLAGQILAPGVYCFDNAATLTGTLTLAGPSTGQWLFKIGAAGIPGGLAGTNFNVVMAGGASACNVAWWVRQASAMTTSNFKGHILAGAGVSFTGGTYKGNAWSKEDVTVTGTAVTACDAP